MPPPESTRRRLSALFGESDAAVRSGHYPVARSRIRSAISLARADPTFRPELARAWCDLGILCKLQGRFSEGLRAYRASEKILRSFLPPDAPDFATIQHNLGGLEHERRRFARAEPFARRSVEIRRKALGNRHPDLIADFAALGAILHDRRKYAEAERIFRRVLRFYRAANRRTRHREDIAVALHNLAATEVALGRPASAISLYREAIRIKKAHFGPRHPEVALTLNNLAMVYLKAREWPRAEELLGEAIEIFDGSLGRRHPRTRIARGNLSRTLSRRRSAAPLPEKRTGPARKSPPRLRR